MNRRTLFFESPRRVRVASEPLPEPRTGQVLVQTVASAISSGTEMLAYRGRVGPGVALDATLDSLAGTFEYPFAYGYAAVGRVVDSRGQTGVSPDVLVFAFVPHRDFFWADPDSLLPVPPGLSAEQASLAASAETAVNLLLDGVPRVGERALVFGLGVLGQLTTKLLERSLCDRVVAVEPLAGRRQRALDWGISAAVAPGVLSEATVDELLGGPADLAIELSGSPAAVDRAIACAGIEARIVLGSWFGSAPVEVRLDDRFHRRRLVLLSSQVSRLPGALSPRWTHRRRMQQAWRCLQLLDAHSLITHRFDFAQADRAYALVDTEPDRCGQVCLTYGEA